MDRDLVHLDTHVVVWLYAGRLELLSDLAKKRIEAADLRVSPMVELELQYLFETARIAVPAQEILTDLESRLGLRLADEPFAAVVSAARDLGFTRDPFDRLIVAQAEVAGATLLTKDRTILAHAARAVWD